MSEELKELQRIKSILLSIKDDSWYQDENGVFWVINHDIDSGLLRWDRFDPDLIGFPPLDLKRMDLQGSPADFSSYAWAFPGVWKREGRGPYKPCKAEDEKIPKPKHMSLSDYRSEIIHSIWQLLEALDIPQEEIRRISDDIQNTEYINRK